MDEVHLDINSNALGQDGSSSVDIVGRLRTYVSSVSRGGRMGGRVEWREGGREEEWEERREGKREGGREKGRKKVISENRRGICLQRRREGRWVGGRGEGGKGWELGQGRVEMRYYVSKQHIT